MKTIQISLNSIDKVKAFVNDITRFDNDFDLVSGRYVIDAKSIMGIFSLDLSKPIDLSIHAEDNLDEILETSLILDMETKFLCREDCKGLCDTCGANLNLGPCGCRKPRDPRFAVLEQLLDKE